MRKKCSFKSLKSYTFPHFSYAFFVYIYHVLLNDTHKRKISSIYNCWHIYNLLSIQKSAIFETYGKQFCMFLTRKI
jgi:hypothetical protein